MTIGLLRQLRQLADEHDVSDAGCACGIRISVPAGLPAWGLNVLAARNRLRSPRQLPRTQ
jgi:hypothetical protein